MQYFSLSGNYPKLTFHFELKRSILYFILETYVPSSLLVVLSWVSFWISQSSVPARICIGKLSPSITGFTSADNAVNLYLMVTWICNMWMYNGGYTCVKAWYCWKITAIVIFFILGIRAQGGKINTLYTNMRKSGLIRNNSQGTLESNAWS